MNWITNETRTVTVWANWYTQIEDGAFLCERTEDFSEYPASIDRIFGEGAESFEDEFLAEVVIVRVPVVRS